MAQFNVGKDIRIVDGDNDRVFTAANPGYVTNTVGSTLQVIPIAGQTMLRAKKRLSAAGTTTDIVPLVVSKKINIMAITATATTSRQLLQFWSGDASTSLSAPIEVARGVQWSLHSQFARTPWFQTSISEGFSVTQSIALDTSFSVLYYTE